MKRAVIVICDGHRADFVGREWCPHIAGLAERARIFANHRAIFPSATRASAASVATGCWPASHGLHGNTMALDDGDGLVLRDSGAPEFRHHMRRATGRTLRVPTLAERVARSGGAIGFGNVSPGATYFQDPDHHGYLYNRAGSFAPGGAALGGKDGLVVSADGAGDLAMTERFCADVLLERRPTVAIVWLANPDEAMHADLLGSATHLEGIAVADACVRQVEQTVGRLRAEGDDVLLVVGSDHGHETIAEAIPVEQLLIDAGLKDGPGSRDLLVAPQGSSGHLYLAEDARGRLPAIVAFLTEQPWVGQLFVGDELRTLGQAGDGGHALSFAMRTCEEPNPNGVMGLTDICVSEAKPGKPHSRRRSQHERGLQREQQSNRRSALAIPQIRSEPGTKAAGLAERALRRPSRGLCVTMRVASCPHHGHSPHGTGAIREMSDKNKTATSASVWIKSTRKMPMLKFGKIAIGMALGMSMAAGAAAQTPTVFTIMGDIDSTNGPFSSIDVGDDFVVNGVYDADLALPLGTLTPFDDPLFMFMLELFDDGTMNTIFGPLTQADDAFFGLGPPIEGFGPLYGFDTNGDLDSIDFTSASLDPSTTFFAAALTIGPAAGDLLITAGGVPPTNDVEITGSLTSISVSPN